MPRVSVIIPCFNQGRYLAEAVASVIAQTFPDFEIIVVNDGSTELESQHILQSFSAPKTRVIHSDNHGLSAARNLGIQSAAGTYILPLDCDDKIAPTYLAKAVALLDSDPRLGIVYCQAEYFGIQVGPWLLPTYRFPESIIHPAIFCAALYRRSDWQDCGGYSLELKEGYEDHDFWLQLIKRGRTVHCINEVLFFYRRTPDSMTDRLNLDKQVGAFTAIIKHHKDLFIDHIDVLLRRLFAREAQVQASSGFPVIQLFVDAGRGYNESESIRSQYAAGDWVTIDLPLANVPKTSHPTIRLDPGMQAGCYDISELTLVHADHSESPLFFEGGAPPKMLKVEGTALLLTSSDYIRVFSYGSDPQIIVSGQDVSCEADAVMRIRVRYHPTIDAASDFFNQLQAQAIKSCPILQLFADAGHGYRELDSARAQYSIDEWLVVEVPLPNGATTEHFPLRLDPGMQPGCYDISELTLVRADRSESSLFLEGNAPASLLMVEGSAILLQSSQYIRVFSYGNDPQILVGGLRFYDEVGAVVRIKIRYRPAIEAASESFDLIQVQINRSRPMLQLFADTGKGYNEIDSVRMRYSSDDWVVLELPLPKGASTQSLPLRLDPGMRAGCYDISELTLVEDGKPGTSLDLRNGLPASAVKVDGPAFVLPSSGYLRILSHGTDPQLILHGLALTENSDALRVKIRFQSSIEALTESFSLLSMKSGETLLNIATPDALEPKSKSVS